MSRLIPTLALLLVAACSEPAPPAPPAPPAAPEPPQAGIDVPAGEYAMDPRHASLHFSVSHLGLSNYVMRFSAFDVTLNLNPDDISQSSVQMSIDPSSVAVDYRGDYRARHKNSDYETWPEALAQSPQWLHAGEHPQIQFESTQVRATGAGQLQVVGDLSLRGQTHPVTLDVRVVGAKAEHPFSGHGAIGFSATGSFNRSRFGITHLVDPPIVGDEVTVRFEGEFNQVVASDEPA